MRGCTHRAALALAVALAGGTWLGVARGQIQVQQNGSALDANPLVGSGGSNTPIQGYVPINGNNIINGNVSGLSYFHAPAGTTSSYTFQGTLGTSTLQNFERQSAGGIPTAPSSISSVYYLPSSIVSGAQGTFHYAPNANGFNQRLAPSSAISPLASGAAAPSPVAAGLPIRAFDIAAAAQPNPSGPTELTSPLYLGNIRSPLQVVGPGQEAKPGAPGNKVGNNGVNGGTENKENDEGIPSSLPQLESNLPTAPGEGGPGGMNQNGAGALAQNGNMLPGQASNQNGNQSGNQNGWQQNNGTMRVSGVYSNLMDEIAKARRPGPTNLQQIEPGQNAQTGNASAVARGNAPQPGSHIPGAPGQPAAGIPGNAVAANGAGGAGGAAPTIDPTQPNYRTNILGSRSPGAAGTGAGASDLMDLANTSPDILRAGSKIAQLPSLAPTGAGKVTPFDELMKQAEAQLKEGDYLSAGDTYQMAVRSEPNNPLAILGRGNAELAAGMYQSASSDLEFVFEKKPELISVKYALGDYIPVKRQGQLVADLGTLAQSKTTGNMASFLLCYLCYQTGRNEELHAELDRWAARPWKDQWQTIAEKAWR